MRKTLKVMDQPKTPKIFFYPKTEEEKEYLVKLTALLKQKRRGDWGLVAEMMGITQKQSAEKAFLRVYSINHFEAVAALEKVIENRKSLLKK